MQLPSGTETRFRVAGIVRALDHDGRVVYVRAAPLLRADPRTPSSVAVVLARRRRPGRGAPRDHRAHRDRGEDAVGVDDPRPALPRDAVGARARDRGRHRDRLPVRARAGARDPRPRAALDDLRPARVGRRHAPPSAGCWPAPRWRSRCPPSLARWRSRRRVLGPAVTRLAAGYADLSLVPTARAGLAVRRGLRRAGPGGGRVGRDRDGPPVDRRGPALGMRRADAFAVEARGRARRPARPDRDPRAPCSPSRAAGRRAARRTAAARRCARRTPTPTATGCSAVAAGEPLRDRTSLGPRAKTGQRARALRVRHRRARPRRGVARARAVPRPPRRALHLGLPPAGEPDRAGPRRRGALDRPLRAARRRRGRRPRGLQPAQRARGGRGGAERGRRASGLGRARLRRRPGGVGSRPVLLPPRRRLAASRRPAARRAATAALAGPARAVVPRRRQPRPARRRRDRADAGHPRAGDRRPRARRAADRSTRAARRRAGAHAARWAAAADRPGRAARRRRSRPRGARRAGGRRPAPGRPLPGHRSPPGLHVRPRAARAGDRARHGPPGRGLRRRRLRRAGRVPAPRPARRGHALGDRLLAPAARRRAGRPARPRAARPGSAGARDDRRPYPPQPHHGASHARGRLLADPDGLARRLPPAGPGAARARDGGRGRGHRDVDARHGARRLGRRRARARLPRRAGRATGGRRRRAAGSQRAAVARAAPA